MTSIVVPSRSVPIAGAHGSPAAAIAARRERVFFSSLAVLLLVTVFGGFARTYFLNGFVSAPFALTPALHWHGAVFTAWMLLLVTQTSLVATGRAHLHRRLGVVGAVLAVAMIGLGGHVAISRTAGGTIADHGAPPLLFLAVPLVGMVGIRRFGRLGALPAPPPGRAQTAHDARHARARDRWRLTPTDSRFLGAGRFLRGNRPVRAGDDRL